MKNTAKKVLILLCCVGNGSYLVCSMYSEAESLASSILKRLCKYDDKSFVEVGEEDVGFRDMLESTGMVLVQSLKALGRYLSLNSYVCFEREA